MAYPTGAYDTPLSNPSATTEEDDAGYEHDIFHGALNDRIIALQQWVGYVDDETPTTLTYSVRHHGSRHSVGGGDGLTGDLDATARNRFYTATTLRGTRRGLNLLAGSGVTLSAADDAANERVNVTISATGGGGGIAQAQMVFLADPSGNASTDTTNWQNALNIANTLGGVHIVPAAGLYLINSVLTRYNNTYIDGPTRGDTGGGSTPGCVLRWSGGTGPGSGRGLLEGVVFQTGTGTLAPMYGFRMSGIAIDLNGATAGNCTVLWDKASVIEHCWFYGAAGTTAGNGRGVWYAGASNLAGGTLNNAGVQNFIMNCRFQTLRERIYSDSSNYTDWVIRDIILENANNSFTVGTQCQPDIRLAGFGGGIMSQVHSNGSLGSTIYLDNCALGDITDCYLDGWGCNAQEGQFSGIYAAIQIASFTKRAGYYGIPHIDNNRFLFRPEQVRGVGDTTKIWPCIRFGVSNGNPNLAQVLGNVVFEKQDGSNVFGDPTHHYFLDCPSPSSGSLRLAVHDNMLPLGTASGEIPEQNVFNRTFNAFTTAEMEGNSWQYGDSTPHVSGNWPRGMKRWMRNPSAGGTQGWFAVDDNDTFETLGSGGGGGGGGSGSFPLVVSVDGVLATTGSTGFKFRSYGNHTIQRVEASLAVASSSGAVRVDVNKNGTTVFTTQNNRPNLVAALDYDAADTIEVASLADGDFLTVDVDSVGTGASDLLVTIWLAAA